MGRHLRGGSVGAGRPGGGRERGNVRARRRRPRDQGVPRGVPRVARRAFRPNESVRRKRERDGERVAGDGRVRVARRPRGGGLPRRVPGCRGRARGHPVSEPGGGVAGAGAVPRRRTNEGFDDVFEENRRRGARKDAKRRVFVFVCFRAFVLQSRGGFRELTGAFETRARRDARVPVRGERRGRRVRVRVGPRARPRRRRGGRHAKQSRRGSASVAGRQRARRRRRDAERRDGVRQDLTGGHREHHAILRERRVRAGVGRAGGAVRAWRDQAPARHALAGARQAARRGGGARRARARLGGALRQPRGGTARVPGRARRRDERGEGWRADGRARAAPGMGRGRVGGGGGGSRRRNSRRGYGYGYETETETETEGGRAQRGFGVARASVERMLPRGAGCRSVDSVRYPGSVRRGVAASRRQAPAPAGAAFPSFRRAQGGRRAPFGQSLAQRFARVAALASGRARWRSIVESARTRCRI